MQRHSAEAVPTAPRHSITVGRLWAIAAVLFSAVLLSTLIGSANQQDDYSFSINRPEVSDLFFLNESDGWITVANHEDNTYYTLATTNGGKDWTKWNAPEGMFRIWFVSKSLGWALKQVPSVNGKGQQVYLLRTETGGKTWNQISAVLVTSQTRAAYSRATLAFVDGLRGWFVGTNAFAPVLETYDGGRTIHMVPSLPILGNVYGIYALPNQGVWIYGAGFVCHSKDLGKTWTDPVNLKMLDTNAFAFNVMGMTFSETGRGWLVGQDSDGMILKTEDFGVHWKRVLEDQDIGNFLSVSFWDNSNGCAVGYPTFLTCTQDGGITWASRDVLPPAKGTQSELFSKLVVLKSGLGWLLRAGGYLYSTADGGQTWQVFDPLR